MFSAYFAWRSVKRMFRKLKPLELSVFGESKEVIVIAKAPHPARDIPS